MAHYRLHCKKVVLQFLPSKKSHTRICRNTTVRHTRSDHTKQLGLAIRWSSEQNQPQTNRPRRSRKHIL